MPVPELSSIEEQIVLRIAGGETAGRIAGELRLSLKTVEWHLARGRRKLERAAMLLDGIETTAAPGHSTRAVQHTVNGSPPRNGASR